MLASAVAALTLRWIGRGRGGRDGGVHQCPGNIKLLSTQEMLPQVHINPVTLILSKAYF